jgi:hypothetical protein
MDIFCCGMYRSCSTWQYEIAIEVLEFARDKGGTVEVQPLGYMTGPEYNEAPRASRSRTLVRIFKGHEGHHSYTNAMFRSRAIGLYAHRDVRDVIFSLMYKRKQSFQEIVRTGMIHQILVNDRFWRAHPHVFVQRYDDIQEKPEQAVLEIAEFLHVNLPGGFAAQLAETYSREANLKRTEDLKSKLTEQGLDLETPLNAQVYDQSTLLHWNHIRADSSNWRTLATPKERVVLQRMVGDWLADNGYQADHLEDVEPSSSATKNWRLDAAQGLMRCHSREFSSAYYRISQPLKQWLGMGAGERRSKPLEKVAKKNNSA